MNDIIAITSATDEGIINSPPPVAPPIPISTIFLILNPPELPTMS